MWNAAGSFATNGMSGLSLLEVSNLTIIETISNYSGYGVSCNGENDGWIDISIIGGTSPYFYEWSHGPQAEDLPAGLV
mgnify:FL=1